MQKLNWEGIEIEIIFVEDYSPTVEKNYGEKMHHITIKANEELPITETGYKSIFILESNLERWGGLEKYILDELSLASKTDAWEFKKISKNQLCLF